MLVITPTVSSDDDIEYPKEDGPYTIFISAKKMSGSVMWLWPGPVFNIGPFCYASHPNYIYYNIENRSDPIIFYVNGERQENMFPERPKIIKLSGFIGFAPTLFRYLIKMAPFDRISVIGLRVDEIDICDDIT